MTNKTLTQRHIVLENAVARLEPLGPEHVDALNTIAADKDIWQFTSSRILNAEDFLIYMEQAMHERNEGLSYPFALIDRKTMQVVGCTRYGSIELKHRRLEIGWTWLDRSVRNTGFNRACKFLLLSYGFDELALNRIELKTSALNKVSQRAIEKIGGVREGLFRRHMINPDGTVRDTIYYSLIREEWAATRQTFFSDFV